MLIRIHGSGVDLDGPFRDWVEGRLTKSLSRFGHRIRYAEVLISDENGPKGGTDKRARCVIRVPGRRTVVVEVSSGDPRSLVDLLVQRLAHAVGRQVDRRRDLVRSGRRHVA